MERLTHRRMSDGAVCANIEESKVLIDFPEFTQKVYDRLAAYEDTGLTPEEVETSLKAVFNRCVALTRGGMCIFCELRNLCDKKRTVYNTSEEAEAALAKGDKSYAEN